MSSRFDLRALRDRDELTAVGGKVAAEIKSDDVPSLAAAVAFKIVLALFPALVAVIGVFGVVTKPEDLEQLLQNLTGAVPQGVMEFLNDALTGLIENDTAGGVAAVVGILGGLWAASGAAATLNKALTRAFDESEGRKLVAMRGTALLVTIALLAALIGIFLLLIVGGNIENSVLEALPLTDAARGVFDFGSTIVRYLLAAVTAMLLFAFIYWIGPDYAKRPSWAWITPGAVVGVVTFLIASGLFGVYTSYSGTYTGPNSIYGSLGSAILFMLWLQITMFALLLGAEVNQVLARRARRRRSGVAADAGSVGTGDDGHRRAAATRSAGSAASAGGGLRAATTPTRGRVGVARSRATAGRPNRTDPATDPTPGHERLDHTGAGHALDGHGGDGSAAKERSVPTATLLGAGVAALSSLVGLTGLLRRLKG